MRPRLEFSHFRRGSGEFGVRRKMQRMGLAFMIALGVAGLSRSSGSERTARGRLAAPHTEVTPDLLLTGATRETRAVEARAGAFVQAVRNRDGARAARFLSRRTAPRVRLAVARRQWPWRTAAQDLGLLFARRDLRLRTLAIRRDRARVRLWTQQHTPGSREPAGFYDLGMVREGVRWQVLLPASSAPRAGGRRPR